MWTFSVPGGGGEGEEHVVDRNDKPLGGFCGWYVSSVTLLQSLNTPHGSTSTAKREHAGKWLCGRWDCVVESWKMAEENEEWTGGGVDDDVVYKD